MPVNYKELLEALEQLAHNHNIRVTVKSSLKGSAIAASTTMIGGLLLGPIGLAIGGAVGGSIGYLVSGDFKSVAAVIREDMNDEERQNLAQRIVEAFKEVTAEDLISLTALIAALKSKNHSFKDVAIDVTKKFLSEKMPQSKID